jgi:amino acid transporter
MILGPPFYAVMANICYTFGPMTNMILARAKPRKRLFQIGLFFSLALTAMPGIWAVYCWVNTLITGQKMD